MRAPNRVRIRISRSGIHVFCASSNIEYRTGVSKSVMRRHSDCPPMMTTAIGWRLAAPEPLENATGSMLAMSTEVVMSMGLSLVRDASTRASSRGFPRDRNVFV